MMGNINMGGEYTMPTPKSQQMHTMRPFFEVSFDKIPMLTKLKKLKCSFIDDLKNWGVMLVVGFNVCTHIFLMCKGEFKSIGAILFNTLQKREDSQSAWL